VHYPPSVHASDSALFEVFVTDYLLDPAGSSTLGQPVLSATVNQADSLFYATARAEDGFVPIGEIEIDLGEEGDVKTVVVKLSASQEDRRHNEAPALLLADAVRLARIE
jgi:hypothetical protein